jgi:hypothetical protein
MRKKRRWGLLIADSPVPGTDGTTDLDRFASSDDPSEGCITLSTREAGTGGGGNRSLYQGLNKRPLSCSPG